LNLKTIVYTAKILMVDDEENNLIVAERFLRQAGYTDIHATTDSRMVLPLFERISPDILFLDLKMPAPDGYELLEQMARLRPVDGEYIPVLVLTADITPGTKLKTLAMGANDFLTKPFERGDLLLRTRNLLETRFLYREMASRGHELEVMRERAERAEKACETMALQLANAGEYVEFQVGAET
jgi:putative two-component system response regulator